MSRIELVIRTNSDDGLEEVDRSYPDQLPGESEMLAMIAPFVTNSRSALLYIGFDSQEPELMLETVTMYRNSKRVLQGGELIS